MSTTAQIRDLRPRFVVKAQNYRQMAADARKQAAEARATYDKAPSGFGASAALGRQKKALDRAADLDRMATFAEASAQAAGKGVLLTTSDQVLSVVHGSDREIQAVRRATAQDPQAVKYDPADARWWPEGHVYTPTTKAPDTLADYRANKGLPSDPKDDPDLNPSPTDGNPAEPSIENRMFTPIGGW